MAGAAVPLVHRMCIATVYAVHALGEILRFDLDEQVKVIRHQAPEVQSPIEACGGAMEECDEQVSVVVTAVDRGAVVPSRGDVVDPGRLDSRRSWHRSEANGAPVPTYERRRVEGAGTM
jgi:hypothetical protein